MNLKRRVEKLEQGIGTTDGIDIITWDVRGPLISLEGAGRVWNRNTDETEDSFVCRVKLAVDKGVQFLWGETEELAYV